MKKTVVSLAAAALALAPATGALASTDRATVLHLVGTTTSQVQQPHGFSFTEVLRDASGKKVGNDLGECVFMTDTSADCEVGVALDGGVIALTFPITKPHQSVFRGPVVAGTGVFAGATGRFRAVANGNKTAITIWYRT